jgi:hypothetical protein
LIVKEQEIKNKLKAKGKLVAIDDDGLHIEDEKSGEVETLSLDELKIFKGRIINISVADTTKLDIKPDKIDEDEETDNDDDYEE